MKYKKIDVNVEEGIIKIQLQNKEDTQKAVRSILASFKKPSFNQELDAEIQKNYPGLNYTLSKLDD